MREDLRVYTTARRGRGSHRDGKPTRRPYLGKQREDGRRNTFFLPGVDAPHVYVRAWALAVREPFGGR